MKAGSHGLGRTDILTHVVFTDEDAICAVHQFQRVGSVIPYRKWGACPGKIPLNLGRFATSSAYPRHVQLEVSALARSSAATVGFPPSARCRLVGPFKRVPKFAVAYRTFCRSKVRGALNARCSVRRINPVSVTRFNGIKDLLVLFVSFGTSFVPIAASPGTR